jgi:predicted lipoprotein with Yx(FWY)xxD motif
MKKLYMIILLLVIGLATYSFAAEKSFKAMLVGSESVPAVETMAKGDATFTPIKDEEGLSYYVTVSDIDNVTAAHIHLGKKGENGPPVALITNDKKAGKFSGTIAEGTITKKDLMGSMTGKSVEDLIKQIKKGNAYLNVHTDKYPNGEIRGQIK